MVPRPEYDGHRYSLSGPSQSVLLSLNPDSAPGSGSAVRFRSRARIRLHGEVPTKEREAVVTWPSSIAPKAMATDCTSTPVTGPDAIYDGG
jgi:hypothetical protein